MENNTRPFWRTAKLTSQTYGYSTIALIGLIAALLPVPANNRGEGFLSLSVAAVLLMGGGRMAYHLLRLHPSPTRQLLQELRSNLPWLAKSFLVYFSLALTLEVGSGIKKSIPLTLPFYADPFLIDLDRFIFGTDPWRLTHGVLGWATHVFSWFYDLWHPIHIGLAIWIALSFNEARKIQFALSFQLSWLLLGGLFATLASSVGPVMVADFYPDQSFVPLIDALRESAPNVLRIKNVLISTMDDPLIISGISAMPSMHVAIAILFALWLQGYRKWWLKLVGWFYACMIYVGSIHLGWHYATDGIVSAVLVASIWWLAGAFSNWVTQSAHSKADSNEC